MCVQADRATRHPCLAGQTGDEFASSYGNAQN